MSKLTKGSKWAVGIIGLAGVIVFAAARIRAASSSHPNVVTFSVELGAAGNFIAATGYQLEPVVDRSNKVVYSLRITRRLSTDTSWVNALQSGTVYNPAVVKVYDSTFAQVNSYTIGNAAVVSVRHTGNSAETFVTEEIALVGTSLSATAP